jgi:hypothetical protein
MQEENENKIEYNRWKPIKQDFVGNIVMEILEMEDEKEGKKHFLRLSKLDKNKQIVVQIDDAEAIAKGIIRLVSDD